MVAQSQQVSIGMATFARYYAATDVHKVRMVKDALTFHYDREGYKKRDYYWDFTNTLKSTHWLSNNLADFESKVDNLVSRQLKQSREGKHIDRRNNYRTLSDAYCRFVKKENAGVFLIVPGHIDIAGLRVIINPDIGMRYDGNTLALELWLAAPRPTRPYRQAIQYLMEEAQRRGWQPNLQPALWDIRRERIEPRPPMPAGLGEAVEDQAVAFLHSWHRHEV